MLAKRLRAWVNADGFITALDGHNLVRLEAGPPARWTFLASAGDGRRVELCLEAHMPGGQNAVVLRWPAPPIPARTRTCPRDIWCGSRYGSIWKTVPSMGRPAWMRVWKGTSNLSPRPWTTGQAFASRLPLVATWRLGRLQAPIILSPRHAGASPTPSRAPGG